MKNTVIIILALLVFDAAADSTVFSHNAIGGQIYWAGGTTYYVYTGVYNVNMSTITGRSMRAFFQFDTSILPESANVTSVELYLSQAIACSTPLATILPVYMGNIIGTSLDSGDWTRGTSLSLDVLGTCGADAYCDLSLGGVDDLSLVNVSGFTDIKVQDGNTVTPPASYFCFEKQKVKTVLRVNYTLLAESTNTTQTNPANITTDNADVLFGCNASSNYSLVNMSIWLANSTSNWARWNTTVKTGTFNTTNVTRTLDPENYTWKCEACNAGACVNSSENWTVNVTAATPTPSPSVTAGLNVTRKPFWRREELYEVEPVTAATNNTWLYLIGVVLLIALALMANHNL